MYKIYAIVKEKVEPQFVINLTESDYLELTEDAIERLVKNWCTQRSLTFIDYQG